MNSSCIFISAHFRFILSSSKTKEQYQSFETGVTGTHRTLTNLNQTNMKIDLIDIAKKIPDLNITIKAGELKEAMEHCVNMIYMVLEEHKQLEDTYPTPTEVTKILGVSKSTLWRWAKQNYLVPIEVGGKRRYRMSDINRLLEKR
mgnify:FL=1